MVVTRRQWSVNLTLPPKTMLGVNYSPAMPESFFFFIQFQSVDYVLRLPLHLRIFFQGGEEMSLFAYSRAARRSLFTWARVLRHVIWGYALPFSIILEVRGLGYKLTAKVSDTLELILGFSHLVYFKLPTGVSAKTLGIKSRAVSVSCMDWLRLTQTLAAVKRLRKVNVYKERGIFYRGEVCARLKDVKRKKN